MVDKNEEYKTVFSLLLKETKDRDETEEILEELAVYVTREDHIILLALSAKQSPILLFCLQERIYDIFSIRQLSLAAYELPL